MHRSPPLSPATRSRSPSPLRSRLHDPGRLLLCARCLAHGHYNGCGEKQKRCNEGAAGGLLYAGRNLPMSQRVVLMWLVLLATATAFAQTQTAPNPEVSAPV